MSRENEKIETKSKQLIIRKKSKISSKKKPKNQQNSLRKKGKNLQSIKLYQEKNKKKC